MAKQRADNGIDYTPRRPDAQLRMHEAQRLAQMQRHTHGTVQRQQQYPIFEVTCAGKCAEWTDARVAAHNAFVAVSTLPKRLSVVYADGRRILLEEVTAFTRVPLAKAA